jgi:hypothetical protein
MNPLSPNLVWSRDTLRDNLIYQNYFAPENEEAEFDSWPESLKQFWEKDSTMVSLGLTILYLREVSFFFSGIFSSGIFFHLFPLRCFPLPSLLPLPASLFPLPSSLLPPSFLPSPIPAHVLIPYLVKTGSGISFPEEFQNL